jgi:hypothetical protein
MGIPYQDITKQCRSDVDPLLMRISDAIHPNYIRGKGSAYEEFS